MPNTPIDAPQQAGAEQSAVIAAIRDQRIKGIQTEAAQGCAATQGGLIRPDEGGGNPEVDQAAASARGLENRPLIVLTAGRYWRPDDPVAAREIAEFHEVWVHQLQSDLANLYRTSGQASKSACWVHFREMGVIRQSESAGSISELPVSGELF